MHRGGRRGMGGMDEGSPDSYEIRFEDGGFVSYDDWIDLTQMVPFRIVTAPRKSVGKTKFRRPEAYKRMSRELVRRQPGA